jgi:quinol monooxygenase YgiN
MPRTALIFLLLGSLPAFSQSKPDEPVYVVTFVDVSPATAADAAALLKQFAADSRKDPGCLRFEALRDISRTNHLTLWEVWRSRSAFEAHLAAPYSKQMREKLQPMLGSPFDERLHIVIP